MRESHTKAGQFCLIVHLLTAVLSLDVLKLDQGRLFSLRLLSKAQVADPRG